MNQKSLTVWQGQDVPAPTPELSKSMQPRELEDHRTEICSDVEMILDGYWKDRPSPEMKARILADWADTLEDWEQRQVLWALRKWRNDFPNKKPNPGHILIVLKDQRGRAAVKRAKPIPQKFDGPRPTSDEEPRDYKAESDRIMAEVMGRTAASMVSKPRT